MTTISLEALDYNNLASFLNTIKVKSNRLSYTPDNTREIVKGVYTFLTRTRKAPITEEDIRKYMKYLFGPTKI